MIRNVGRRPLAAVILVWVDTTAANPGTFIDTDGKTISR